MSNSLLRYMVVTTQPSLITALRDILSEYKYKALKSEMFTTEIKIKHFLALKLNKLDLLQEKILTTCPQ